MNLHGGNYTYFRYWGSTGADPKNKTVSKITMHNTLICDISIRDMTLKLLSDSSYLLQDAANSKWSSTITVGGTSIFRTFFTGVTNAR